MLPSTLQFVIAMIACAINERMQRKLDYTREEVQVLKGVILVATGTVRFSFTADQRRRLAVAGKELSPEERRKYCQLVKPATIPRAPSRHFLLEGRRRAPKPSPRAQAEHGPAQAGDEHERRLECSDQLEDGALEYVARAWLAEPEHDPENHIERDRPHRVFDDERPVVRPACRVLAGDPGDDRAIVVQSLTVELRTVEPPHGAMGLAAQ